jgi:nuclear transport factor 2 (NTF2) superfamily protein
MSDDFSMARRWLTPPFYVEVDHTTHIIPIPAPFFDWQNLTEVVGLAARELHSLSRYEVRTAFVYKTRDKHCTLYSFDFRRPKGYKLIAILVALPENRVKVYYRIDKPQEVLYL